MKKKTGHILETIGWWFMSIPVGYSKPCMIFMRYGPYRWGAWLHNWPNSWKENK